MFDLFVLDLVFIFNGLVCMLCFCVSLDHFGFVFYNSVLLGLVFFQYRAKRLAVKKVSEMTDFVSSGTWHLTQFSSENTARQPHINV